MNDNLKKLLERVSISNVTDNTSYNIKYNGENIDRNYSDDVKIVSKKDKPGIDVIVKENVKGKTVAIPVIIDIENYKETVYNEFYIGKNSEVTILAGCAIEHDDCDVPSEHNGIHTFHLEENAKVKYVEKHYGCGEEYTKFINTETIVDLKKGSILQIDTTQIEGVDSTIRKTIGTLHDNASLVIDEKIMTNNNEKAITNFEIVLEGKNSNVVINSKSIATGASNQEFISSLTGNNECSGYVSCDAIMTDKSRVISTPKICANNVLASLTHEATIGRIAQEQLIKLMTLGLNEQEAEDIIIKSFLN